ncbi:hypothetical protein MBM_09648 [Drepanopeziza brunnea f. sp. 'multigermtubi' MB_m1]|uniref:Uncharacterized protein n=1 Tax=Marssonina brunnea f. sp. multigermtubi (strain MB_m1) TaxID=1072389 RepID=K1XIA8_MARBU|nr:uncharacterized protein MBM_09648 [Drepanopeziza brunnea f. sp. 'multigermtubi' MB_m1]EKD12149.1 hypothetical protein MBM_09648 [Drepanopeziza brunnea f. sp. 'multigermtubi' MB_m1]
MGLIRQSVRKTKTCSDENPRSRSRNPQPHRRFQQRRRRQRLTSHSAMNPNNAISAPGPQLRSRLLRLPCEIRDQIWHEALGDMVFYPDYSRGHYGQLSYAHRRHTITNVGLLPLLRSEVGTLKLPPSCTPPVSFVSGLRRHPQLPRLVARAEVQEPAARELHVVLERAAARGDAGACGLEEGLEGVGVDEPPVGDAEG